MKVLLKSCATLVSRKMVFPLFLFLLPLALNAASGQWNSPLAGEPIPYIVTEPESPQKDYKGKSMTVVYLENLGFGKIGQYSNADNISWLLAQGYRVIELDYANHSSMAVSLNINRDIIAINNALESGSFCGLNDCSNYRSYILFEGYRIARDVAYFKDDPTVYNYPDGYTEGDSLYMDIIYPANPREPVPVVLSFSYSNSYATYDKNTGELTDANKHMRLFLPYTLGAFDDSFLEGAPARGIAWAMADHPKYCPWGSGKPVGGANDTYKSYQTNPDAAQKVKSAVRTLRAKSQELGLSGKIGIYGFSRGSDAGAMAVGDRSVPEFENAGLHIGLSDDVQAAALGPGVFDFTQIYNTTDDGDRNLETRCPWAWGPLKDNYELWEKMGAAYLVQSGLSAPVLFFYNTTDSHYYLDQIQKFKEKLEEWAIPPVSLVDYGSGHSVPKDSASLKKLYDFFDQYLTPPSLDEDTTQSSLSAVKNKQLPLMLSYNSSREELSVRFSLAQAAQVEIQLFDMAGMLVFSTEKKAREAGLCTELINLNKLGLQQGIYHVRLRAGGLNTVGKFVFCKS
jgi:dienelactone hydrolase